MPAKLKSHMIFMLLLLSGITFFTTIHQVNNGNAYEAIVPALFTFWMMLLSILVHLVVEVE